MKIDKIVVGEPVINWISLSESVQIVNGKLKTSKVGNAIVRGFVNDNVVKEVEIVVTDTIVAMPNNFNDKKDYLPCNEYTLEESQLLDEILEYRISEAGYQTRAGAVAAARFLTLEFPYRIAYYWETGRLNNTGKKYVDGEGRYYHKGLYLDSSKYDSIEASLFGPAMWGCKMISYEDVNGIIENYENLEHVYIIDVREEDEYEEGHLINSYNIPLSRLEDINNENRDKLIVQ